jgi:hypothetical protein
VGQITRRIDNLDSTKGRAAGLSLDVCARVGPTCARSGHTRLREGSICGCRGRQNGRHDGRERQHLVSHCFTISSNGHEKLSD